MIWKKILSLLGSLTLVGSSIPTTLFSTESFVKNDSLKNLEMNGLDSLDEWFNNLSNSEDTKNNFFSSLELKNNYYVLNVKKITDVNLLKIIGVIKDVKINPYIFKLISGNNKDNLKINGVWIDFEWYWFGWGKICFNHEACDFILDKTAEGMDMIDILAILLETFPELFPFIIELSTYLAISISLISSYDRGRGIWIGTYGFIIYDLGWGSL